MCWSVEAAKPTLSFNYNPDAVTFDSSGPFGGWPEDCVAISPSRRAGSID